MIEQEERLSSLEQHANRTEQRMEAVEIRQVQHGEVLSQHGDKLDSIFQAVTRQEAKVAFDPVRVMQFILLAAGIVSVGGAAITYIATSVSYVPTAENAKRIATLEFMAQEIWKTGRWTPTVERVN